MSGKFGQDKSPKGITWFEPKRVGKFDKYQNQICMIVSGGRKNHVMNLTEAVFQALKRPKFIRIGKAGSVIYLVAAETSEGAYAVMQPKDDKHEPRGTRFLNVNALIREWEIHSGKYDANIEEEGMVSFNKEQKASDI